MEEGTKQMENEVWGMKKVPHGFEIISDPQYGSYRFEYFDKIKYRWLVIYSQEEHEHLAWKIIKERQLQLNKMSL